MSSPLIELFIAFFNIFAVIYRKADNICNQKIIKHENRTAESTWYPLQLPLLTQTLMHRMGFNPLSPFDAHADAHTELSVNTTTCCLDSILDVKRKQKRKRQV